MRQVSRPCRLVVPISLAEPSGQLYTVLRGFKNPSYARHHDFELQVAALIGRFLRDHGSCIRLTAGRVWTTITSVPSTRARSDEHPLERAIKRVGDLRDVYEPLLARGSAPLGNRLASDDGFEVTADVGGDRVLLIDDTFTSGARVQSAASALHLAGADVVAVLIVGRFIRPNPDYPHDQELLDRSADVPFDFSRCCLDW